MSLSYSYRGAGVGVQFDGLDISGDGRAVTIHKSGAFIEALDVTGEWHGAWDLAEGATGTLIVSEYGLERERFEAALGACAINKPTFGLVSASMVFQR
jgi:hypothetical protein